jgi:ribonuclease P protein component
VERLRSEALPKERRLAKRREFVRIYDTGQKHFSRYTVLFFAANGLTHSRIGITATKKLGKANVRNRLKRWTREVYRRQREPLGIDARMLDIVVNVKTNAAAVSFEDYSRDLTRALGRLAREESARLATDPARRSS